VVESQGAVAVASLRRRLEEEEAGRGAGEEEGVEAAGLPSAEGGSASQVFSRG